MIAMERFVYETIIIIGLAILGCFTSKEPYILMLIAGILLCITCDKSLVEKEKLWRKVFRLLLSIGFAIMVHNYLAYLVFYQCRVAKNRYVNVLMPSVMHLLIQLILYKDELPSIIYNTLILVALSSCIHVIQQLIERYITTQNKIAKAVSVTAVNEMYTKKLNQELVMKNYLADKSARLEERENISRNIHNSVGHSITAAIMTLDAADMLFDTAPDKAREKMNTANERMRTSLDSIRQAVRVLDSQNRYVSMDDFISELKAVADNFVMDTMIRVYTDFEDVSNGVVIPHEHTEFLTGAVQELLSNGVRHGNADVFTVTVISDSSNLKVKVADNGKSDFNHDNQRQRIENGFGLKKMISYVKRCGGNVSFFNDNGFKAELAIKLFKEDINE